MANRVLQHNLIQPQTFSRMEIMEACNRTRSFLQKISNIKLDSLFESRPQISSSSVLNITNFLREWFPENSKNPLYSLIPHTVGLQQNLVESLCMVRDEVTKEGWFYDQSYQSHYLSIPWLFSTSFEQQVYIKAKNRLEAILQDLRNAIIELNAFSSGDVDIYKIHEW